ncbi:MULTISPECIES: pyruvate:ferredoxin (flavodoxin) oxidoreductase [unclassified Cyanobium]|uniref:pyruvate:ferredoxin (flavodoxin) oxidoreductase n=1 Tax=unclassified Cyanobium TaxID=2627006 RepID=UPI0020CDC9B4|nr:MULTISPECIES: pyruvate:ferredoxin (flavodoxin) oxidoreductase [unclassified Cyanobium]MCP9833002.1 pyruvate:ferredoxin (flavodoxin) oxidoreductase [Cyanobium sp. La Preciosa 7G6]MCP9935752.1 pyruvate:ferredoxin (flavodoxin) oxidoreductase [Cyanobium sp. Aljojuca 7A6]
MTITVDGNEAVALVAYRLNEAIAIYPITPASPMGEWADAWRTEGRPNLWGTVPAVVELQSEAGAAGTVHGALQAGVLTTTFTASQGLLLMVPNLYKLAGELTPAVLHVAARSLAAQGLSIFGDHSDVMACRGTGCVILCSASVQEAGDFAAIATRASLLGRLPVLHMFDGFRTSHEIQKIEPIDDAVLHALMPMQAVADHRHRALSPDHPVLRGTAQNPDVYFQARESVNRFYDALPGHLVEAMEQFAGLTGRRYGPYEYVGAADAEWVVVLMGSGCETAEETAAALVATGERVGVLKVRLFRPFVAALFAAALPPTVRGLAVLDRCKEPGAGGEPLYLDAVAALSEEWQACHGDRPLPRVVGGRYGLSSKEFTPAMVKAVFDNLLLPQPRNHFTVGIDDDVTHRSLPVAADFHVDGADEVRAVFYGLGSDGTVGGNKATIKIIGEQTDLFAQAYFVYDSKKSGSVTVSHLRFGSRPIRAPYLIERPTLVACHQWDFVDRFDLLAGLDAGGVLLLNSPFPIEESWRRMPAALRCGIRERGLSVWLINAYRVAREAGMGNHINTVMQACFFAVSGVLPRQEAIEQIRVSLRKTYGRKGEAVVAMNLRALDASLDNLQPLDWSQLPAEDDLPAAPPQVDRLADAPLFVREVIAPLLERRGDALPVSALPCDGTWPTGTAQWEKRNIAESVPVWESDLCVQCGKCVMVCPHAVIRAKAVAPEALDGAPEGFRQAPARDPDFKGRSFTIQVAVEDCTGCALCVEVCPARDRTEPKRKAINMAPQRPLRDQARGHWDYFLALPEMARDDLNLHKIGQQQLQQPLFEFSGACGGCGETPYLKLASQLFGDRMLVANATGCSSIYGGNLPTTPWSTNAEGRGPAWSNSLFEDNAEFGLGMRVAIDQQRQMALELLERLGPAPERADPLLPGALVAAIRDGDQNDEAGIVAQRQRVEELKRRLQAVAAEAPRAAEAERLLDLADALVKKSVWLVGGDGWAYDIGFGGLDHVLASGRDVNALVLDTEVYSNTGGQMSKATPRAAVAKYAAGGKAAPKKDLGLMMMSYGSVYVASVAMGARDEHTVRAFLEAESYPGPSLILAYSHCIAHGIDMARGMEQQKAAVDSGRWLLYRYDPRRTERGEHPLQIDSRGQKRPLAEAMATENRFRMLSFSQPERARALARQAELEVARRWAIYRALAGTPVEPEPTPQSTSPLEAPA